LVMVSLIFGNWICPRSSNWIETMVQQCYWFSEVFSNSSFKILHQLFLKCQAFLHISLNMRLYSILNKFLVVEMFGYIWLIQLTKPYMRSIQQIIYLRYEINLCNKLH
jgi:hypothetical protein